MDAVSQEIFDRLVKVDPESLTEAEALFLNARRTYLNNEQRRIFSSVLVKETAEKSLREQREELSNKELCKIIESLGLEVPKQANKDALIKVLEDAEALEEANKEV